MFWVISVYFNVRNILPKSGTFPPGHPVRNTGCFSTALNNGYAISPQCYVTPTLLALFNRQVRSALQTQIAARLYRLHCVTLKLSAGTNSLHQSQPQYQSLHRWVLIQPCLESGDELLVTGTIMRYSSVCLSVCPQVKLVSNRAEPSYKLKIIQLNSTIRV